MSDEDGSARQRRATTAESSEGTETEQTPSSSSGPSEPNNSALKNASDVYSKFVDSLERSLNAVVTGDGRSEPEPALSSLNLEGIAEFIKRKKPRKIIVMTGAGISTSAGIPDFRSPGTGLYSNLAKYELDDPQDIFDIDFFHAKPEPFFTLAKDLFPRNVKPTLCHFFVSLLAKKGILRRWFTQNIDSLEYMTGIEKNLVVPAHGNHHSSTCTKCRTKYDQDWISKVLDDPEQLVPRCEKLECGGVVKPDIVFFGENLPPRFFQCAIQDFPKCDLLIVIGTSLKVQPFAGLVSEVHRGVPRLLINLEPAGEWISPSLRSAALCYGNKRNKRDVFWRGKCDEGCEKLAELIGWSEELERIVQEGPPSTHLL